LPALHGAFSVLDMRHLKALALLALSCRAQQPKAHVKIAAKPPAAIPTSTVVDAPPPIALVDEVPPLLPPSWIPTVVAQDQPAGIPDLYDLVGDRIAYVDSKECRVFSMETQTFAGTTSRAACEKVFSQRRLAVAPDGRTLDDLQLDCNGCEPDAAAFSPDSQQVAVAVESDVLVFDTTTGKKLTSYALDKGDVASPGRMGWGAHGLVVVGGPPDSLERSISSPKHLQFAVYIFGPAGKTKYALADSEAVSVDPRGTWLFSDRSRFHDYAIDVIYVPNGGTSPLSWRSYEGYSSPTAEVARWIPGKHPVFEHIERVIDPGGNSHCTRSHIFTEPGKEKLVVEKVTCVDPEGHAELDPSGRFKAVGSRAILRVADGVTLHFEEGSVRTSNGHFDTIDGGERTVFRLGSDPRNAPVFPAARLQPLLHRPKLATQFFAGDPLPALTDKITPPPILTKSAVKKTPNSAELTLVASGDVKTVRTFVAGKLHKTEPLAAGAVFTVKLPSVRPKKIAWRVSCDDVRAYACNDHSCSAAVVARWCI
jgi:hypothetical protein